MDNDKCVYGVDLDQPITAIIARDALASCFYEAHCADAELGTDDPDISKQYILEIIKKTFLEVGGNYENPSKEVILNVINKLKDFAKNFRDQSIIQKHAEQMIEIVKKIKE